jgi:hypothetical protein
VLKVYIAGPFRAKNSWELECNIREAEQRAYQVARDGMIPVCPHTMYRYFDGTLTDEYWLQATAELLDVCDMVWLGTGWHESVGSVGEAKRATRLGIPVAHCMADVLSLKIQLDK